jgi:hypothetical protein
MWLKNYLDTIIKVCLFLFLLLITMLPVTHKPLFENRFFTAIDSSSTQYIDAALVRATSAYALSRSFNAVVSVFEESHLQVQPAGVGISLALGEVLDPINDLVERFSWVMLASLTALGIQKALVLIGPWFSVTILLPISLGLLLIGCLPIALWAKRSTYLGYTILIAVILVRFAVPVMAFLNQQVYLNVLEETHDKAIGKVSQEMSKLKKEIPELEDTQIISNHPPPQSLWDKTKEALNRTLDQSKEIMKVQNKIQKLKEIATGLIDRMVDLIVVFVLNTIIMPLLFLGVIYKLGRKLGAWYKLDGKISTSQNIS